MKKKFELESIETKIAGRADSKTRMVFSAYDESKQCFVKMVCEPQTIITHKGKDKKPFSKIIRGEIIEIIKYE